MPEKRILEKASRLSQMVSHRKGNNDMQQNPQVNRQLDLFNREERAAILEHDGGYCRQAAEKTACADQRWPGAHEYLEKMINDKEPLINLIGSNPHICLALSLSSYEHPMASKRSWVQRDRAVNMLSKSGYYHHCRVHGNERGDINTWRLG